MSAPSESSVFQALLQAAWREYEERTGSTLIEHPLATQLRTCHTFGSLIALLQEQSRVFHEYRGRGSDDKGVMDSGGSFDVLVNLFESITNFLHRLDIYVKIPPTAAMTEIVVKIMVELLSTVALASKQTRQGRLEKIGQNVLEENGVQAMLQRLDKLTQDEARTTAAQTLQMVYDLVQNVKVVMDDCKASIDSVQEALMTTRQIATDMNNSKRDQFQQDVQNWLSPPDPWEDHSSASEAHHNGTASWLTRGDTFAEWKSSGPLLLIHGKPGSGKSILCSAIIEDIDCMRKGGLASLAFFYFDSRDDKKKDRRNLLSSLLFQFYDQSDSYYKIFSDFYSTHRRGSQYPSDAALTQCLKDMLTCPGQAPIYIIVDGIDECPKSSGRLFPRDKVLMLVKELVGLRLPNLHICMTSRPEVDIETIIHPLTSHSISLHDEKGQIQDIVDYITSIVNSDLGMRGWRVEDRELVIGILSQKADGMFGWAACQLDVLRSCLPLHIRRTLEEYPATLDWTYERVLQDIPDTKWKCAHILLECVLASSRPLLVEELAEFLAFDFNAGPLPQFRPDCRPEDPEDALLSTCPGLFTVVEVNDSRIVQFSHFSVRQFLISGRLAKAEHRSSRYYLEITHAHTVLLQGCLSALLSLEGEVNGDSTRRFPLADYATRHWLDHAQFNNKSQYIQLEDTIRLLLDPSRPHFTTWISQYYPDDYLLSHPHSKSSSETGGTPLHYAALYGLRDVAEFLASVSWQNINALGTSHKETPLTVASEMGHIEIVRLLFERGAILDVLDGSKRTALHWALQEGRLEVAQLLLERGANANTADVKGQAPLHLGSREGHVVITQLLLKQRADPNAKDGRARTSLHWASQEGHLEVVRLLLDKGARPNYRDHSGQTPLHLALQEGRLEVVRLLLDKGAHPNYGDKSGQTPLHLASQEGRLEVAQLLLDKGACLHLGDNNCRTPLHVASQEGRLEVAQLLLDKGADPNTMETRELTPLHLASRGGHRHLVQALLTRSTSMINGASREGGTPFQEASAGGHHDIMQLLLQYGAKEI